MVVQLVGCTHSPDDDYEPAIPPRKVSFEGTANSKFEGTWKATDGSSTLVLKKGGDLQISTTIKSQGGTSAGKTDGKWLVSDGKVKMQYRDVTVEYSATLSGKKLTLQQPGGQITTTYTRE